MLRGRAYATPARLERFHNGIKPTSLLHGRQALCHRAVPPPLQTRWCSQLFVCIYVMGLRMEPIPSCMLDTRATVCSAQKNHTLILVLFPYVTLAGLALSM